MTRYLLLPQFAFHCRHPRGVHLFVRANQRDIHSIQMNDSVIIDSLETINSMGAWKFSRKKANMH